MAVWTVAVEQPFRDGNMVRVNYTLTKDGEQPITDFVRVDCFRVEWLKDFLRERLAVLNFNHEIDAIVPGPLDVAPPAPVPVDAARQAYFNDLVLWRRLKIVGEFRPATLSSAQFTNVVTRLRDNFKAEYLDLI